MAVTAANFLYYTQQGADQVGAAYTAYYQIVCDTNADGPITVRASLPSLGTPLAYGNDTSAAFVTGYGSITPQDWKASRVVWSAEVNYSTIPPPEWKGGEVEIDAHPADYPWELSSSTENAEEAVTLDTFGADIKNTAGDPIDDLTKEKTRARITLRKNKRQYSFSPFAEIGLVNACNLNQFFGGARDTWRCESVTHDFMYYGTGEHYYACSYSFVYDPDGWQAHVVNRGTRDINGKLPPDATGLVFHGNVPLKADGTFKDMGDDLDFVDATIYPSSDFHTLGVPTDYF